MDGRSFRLNEDVDTGLYPLRKRQKSSHHGGLTGLRHTDYTIAWICALYIETAAAQAMLDSIHEPLPKYPDDSNTYVLGSIKQHNIVIASLPVDLYGVVNAASVMTNMKRSFPAICAGLIVGIGGGVPSRANMRLGDIVVGTRVMQCDLGKIVGDGELKRTAIPRIPLPSLSTAVSTIRAKHELGPSRVPFILQQKLEGLPRYGRPGLPDRLFHATYCHKSPTASCDECDQSKLVIRDKRMSNDIMIHYGAIASGNQVMRSGTIRDHVSRELDVICFEMEAAGLMDILHCLPIRGICDYSDSHKMKEWQRYAAATAAAYARELLEELPATESHTTIVRLPKPHQVSSDERRQRLLDSLRFDQIDSRRLTIKTAHAKTCRWLISHPDYKSWLNPTEWTQHNGFLWISGKPGAGKSTMMKFAYSNMKNRARQKGGVTAAFFFNARGEYLEKSVLGMYRSLLLQLLEGYPDLQMVFDDVDLFSQSQNGCPSLNILKDLFSTAISILGYRSFTCFVDALDECDEQQVVDMVQFFEDLAEQSATECVPFRICFSSRHYPYIVIRRGIRLILEDQSGHAEDLAAYVSSRLQVRDPTLVEEVRFEILRKAASVFMWVVLVVDILNKEDRRGGMSLRKRLAEIPSGLSELFKDILRRDNEDLEALLLCILWILYARRPLHPKEFYHALWSGLSLKDLVDDQVPNTTLPDTSDSLDKFNRYVISSSKGLAETTKSKQPTVQFIHESVRDFLIKDKGLHELWPELEFNSEGLGHERLKECCDFYTNHSSVGASVSELLPKSHFTRRNEILKQYPFLEYANQHILYHANAATKQIPQDDFLDSFDISNWINTSNLFEKRQIRQYTPNASQLYIFAENGLSELIRIKLKKNPHIHILGERYQFPLFAALANGKKDCFAALLCLPSTIHNGVDVTEGLNRKKDLVKYVNRTPLSWAAQDGRVGIVNLLLQENTTVDTVDTGGRTPISRAAGNGQEEVLKLLFDKGAHFDVNMHERNRTTPLLHASKNGHEAVVRFLLSKGADINTEDHIKRTALMHASENGHEAVTRLLVNEGANIHARDLNGQTSLIDASAWGHEVLARLFIDKGADVNTCDNEGMTSIMFASIKNREAMARFLIKEEANVNAKDKKGRTALLFASTHGFEEVATLLIRQGANVNASNMNGQTPLLAALENGHEAVAIFLVQQGADVNAIDNSGERPLLVASKGGHEAVARFLIGKGAA